MLERLALLAMLQSLALWSISGSIEQSTRRLGSGPLFSALIIPWVTTLPETLVTVELVASGYPLAGLYNAVVSAVFDMFIVVPLVGLNRRILIPALVAPLPLLALFLVHGGSVILIEGRLIGIAMLLLCILLCVIAGGTSFTIGNVSLQTLLELLSGLSALGFATIEFSNTVTALTAVIGNERLSGTIAAILTSLPDAIYALVARGESGLAELSGCIIHDFLETPAVTLLLGGRLVITWFDALLITLFIVFGAILLTTRKKWFGALAFTILTSSTLLV